MDTLENILATAKEEILTLRRENEILHAKVDVMEFFRCTLLTEPHMPQRGESIDVAWQLEQKIAELNDAQPESAHKEAD